MTQHNERVEEILYEFDLRSLNGDKIRNMDKSDFDWLRTTLQTYTVECEARGRELEHARVFQEISLHTPQLSAQKPKAYSEGLIAGWYACREFIRTLTPPTV